MKSQIQFGKSVMVIPQVAFMSISSMTQIAIAGDQQVYDGTATLCAISSNVVNGFVETRGNNGVLYQDGVYVYRINSEDVNVLNGWELMNNKWKQTKSGNAFYTGEVVLTPEVNGYDGTLEGRFNFRAEDINDISGRYKGTGDFTGVTVEYNLSIPYPVPVAAGPNCDDALAVCPAEADCVNAQIELTPGAFFYLQYDISGWVRNAE